MTSALERIEPSGRGLFNRLLAPFLRAAAWIWAPRRTRRARRLEALAAEALGAAGDDRALLRLGDAYRGLGELSLAQRSYWAAAQLHVSAQRFHHAAAIVRHVVQLAPDALFARRGLAECLERIQRHAEAASQYRAAAVLAHRAARPAEAAAYWAAAQRLDPTPSKDDVAPLPGVGAPKNDLAPSASAPLSERGLASFAERNLAPPAQRDLAPSADRDLAPAVLKRGLAPFPEAPNLGLAPFACWPERDTASFAEGAGFGQAVPGTATEMALDVEAFLLGNDPAEAVTRQAAANMIPDLPTEAARWDQAPTTEYAADELDDLLWELS